MNENEYEEFLNWAEESGLDFPCTREQFYARVVAYSAGDYGLLVRLCERGIGPDWRE